DLLARRKPTAETPVDEREETEEPIEQESAHADDTQEATPEEIMAGVEAGAKETEALTAVGDFDYPPAPAKAPDATYPHLSEVEEDDDRPLTRREIRERERALERAAALGLDTGQEEQRGEHWPTQEPEKAAVATAEPEPKKRRRWWQRKQVPARPSAPGPIVLDDDTGEIVITGEIDVSNLNPQATGDSWRATWGLDQDTPTRWIPVMKSTER